MMGKSVFTLIAALLAAISIYPAQAAAQDQHSQAAGQQQQQAAPEAPPAPSAVSVGGAMLNTLTQQGMQQVQGSLGRGTFQDDMPDLLYHSAQFYNLPPDTFQTQASLSVNFTQLGGNSKSNMVGGMADYFIMKGNLISTFQVNSSYLESGTASLPVQTMSRTYSVGEQLEWYFHPKLYAFGGAHWDSNEIAGFKADYGARGGLGLFAVETKELIFRLEAGYDVTRIERVPPFENESIDFGMAGARFVWIGDKLFLNLSYKLFQSLKNSDHKRQKGGAQVFFGILPYLFYVVSYDLWNDNKVPQGFEQINYVLTNALMVKF